jgi:alanine dehydrogenase
MPGLNVCAGEITHQAVAEALNLNFSAKPRALAA